MYQYKEIVFVNCIEYAGGGVACVMDPFVLTTYIGKHTIGCEVTMFGERHGVGIVTPKKYIGGMSDLNVLHQEAMAKNLREDDVVCIDLEYHDYEQFMSEHE